MKKRILSFLIMLFMVIALLPTNMITVSAYTGTKYGGYLYYTESNGEITITDCDEAVTEIVIPEKINEKKVTSIGSCAFKYCTSLKSITIPDSITSIGDSAFYGCYFLKSITIPNGVSAINNHTFDLCSSLSNVTLPNTITIIGNSAFDGCGVLTNITIPNGVASIGDNAFGACVSLTNITIPDSVTSIGKYAFDGCNHLTSITIPNSVKTIDVYTFRNCYDLKAVYYNGTENDWKTISIGNYNTYLTNAIRTYFAYIKVFDKNGNKVIETTQNMGETVDISDITVPQNCILKFYTDSKMTEEYALDTPISENLDLYYDIIEINKLKIAGTKTADIGQTGIAESVTFATDKTATEFYTTVKYPETLHLAEVKSNDFTITTDSYSENGYTYLMLTCIYDNGNIPINTTLNAFDLVFNVSENVTANEILTVELVSSDTFLANSTDNSTDDFDSVGSVDIKINPILVNGIIINGADEIDKATQYTATILPENATNKDIEWTVNSTEVATISADGILTPIKAGTVKITATAKDGSGIYGEKSVNVKVYAQITSLTSTVGTWDKTFTPSGKEYIIYVPNDTNSIKLTALHNGKLQAGTTTYYTNRAYTVSLSGNETVLTLTYTETGYTDSEYKITIVKFEGTKTTVSDDGKTFTVTPINIETENTVILALYNGNEFVEAKIATYAGKDIPFTTDKTYTNAKVFV